MIGEKTSVLTRPSARSAKAAAADRRILEQKRSRVLRRRKRVLAQLEPLDWALTEIEELVRLLQRLVGQKPICNGTENAAAVAEGAGRSSAAINNPRDEHAHAQPNRRRVTRAQRPAVARGRDGVLLRRLAVELRPDPGVRGKFLLEPNRSALLLTHRRPLAEDSRSDFVWDARDSDRGYGGQNLLGLALMRVRDELIADVRSRLTALPPAR